VSYRNVLVISPSPDYLDEVSEVLADIGGFGVLVQDVDGAAHALDQGFQPEVVLLDALLVPAPDAEVVVLLLRAAPQLAAVPVLVLPSPPAPETPGMPRRRVDRAALVAALQQLDSDSTSP